PSPLAHVLRLLPAQEVVRTFLLARRWRDVWRSVPTLRFTWAKGSGSADRFARFVDACSTSDLRFDFGSDGFMLLPAKVRHASIWLWKALPRVRALRLCFIEEQGASPLSDLHLFSQHLTRLELVVSVSTSVVDFFNRLPDFGGAEYGLLRCFPHHLLFSTSNAHMHSGTTDAVLRFASSTGGGETLGARVTWYWSVGRDGRPRCATSPSPDSWAYPHLEESPSDTSACSC
ncbi:hypothetical protein ZWY2020_059126, partial [Hordeum vulgare]